MADPRNTIGNGSPPALRPVAPIRSEAARAAQRAFFEAALGKSPAAADAPAVRPLPTPSPTPAVRPTDTLSSLSTAFRLKPPAAAAREAIDPSPSPSPSRILRPGSIVDIKV